MSSQTISVPTLDDQDDVSGIRQYSDDNISNIVGFFLLNNNN